MSHASSTALVGGKDDDRKHESDQGESEMAIEVRPSLEDGELEEGELNDDDDPGLVDNKAEQVFASASEPVVQIKCNGAGFGGEIVGKSTASTNQPQQKKTKEIPSLFDLKTTKPKSLKRSAAEDKGKKSFPKYIDHDRIDDEYMNYGAEDAVVAGAWHGYPMQGEEYESSDYSQEPEDEFSIEIQQMLNRSTTGSHGMYDGGDRSPRGPYDSPSEEEEDEEEEEEAEEEEDEDDDDDSQPPSKLQKLEDSDNVSHGVVTKASKIKPKKKIMTGKASNSDTDSYQKKSKLAMNKARKRGEPILSQSGNALLELPVQEKRRLVDTPMDERPQCKFYLEGKCKKGANCPFNHDMKRSTKSDVCRYFLSGQCGKGRECVFSHDLKGASAEDTESRTENQMPKKRKALLGSPPSAHSGSMNAKDKKKIPSLFDIQINAEGPNAKEILQTAARRSVMARPSNPKPGLLGVAPPMIPTGMMGPVRMRFPMNQVYNFDNFGRSHPHEQMDEGGGVGGGQEMLRQGPHNNTDFMTTGMEEIMPAQHINCSTVDSDLVPDKAKFNGQTVEEVSHNIATNFNICNTSAVSVTSLISNPHVAIPNTMQMESESAVSGNMIDQSSMLLSTMPPFLPQLASGSSTFVPALNLMPSPCLPPPTEATDSSLKISVPPTKLEEEKPQIVGGVDVNHLPPKQRELYLRMFAHQKEANSLPADQPVGDKTTESHAEEEKTILDVSDNGSVTTSNNVLKFLAPVSSQANPHALVSETDALNQLPAMSSGSSPFNINQMLFAVFNKGTGGFPAHGSEIMKPPETVFEVSGSSLRGPYRLEPVTLETNSIILPHTIDPKDSKYSADPRVQKHKDDVVLPIRKDEQRTNVTASTELTTKVQTSTQRRDPRLARKETAAVKEEPTQNQNQPLQPMQQSTGGMSIQPNVMGVTAPLTNMPMLGMQQTGISMGGMQQGGMPLGNMQQGGLQMGGMQQGGMQMGGMQQGSMPLGMMHQGGMTMGGNQQGGMTMGGNQQGGMTMGGMHQGGMQMAGMKMNGMPIGCMQMGGMSVGMQQGGMQQGGISMGGGMQQGGLFMGGMQQGNRQMGGMQQGGMPMGAMQQPRINMPMGNGMQQGGLLPQPPVGLLPQRGMMPPFVPQNQMPAMNSFPQNINTQAVTNMLNNALAPFGLCRPGLLQNEMMRPECSMMNPSGPSIFQQLPPSSGNPMMPVDGTGAPSMHPMQNNPFPRALLPTPVQTNTQMPLAFVPPFTCAMSQPSSPPSQQPALSDVSRQDESASNTVQALIPINEPDAGASASNERTTDSPVASETVDANGNTTTGVQRTINYRDDHRFRIKKSQTRENPADISSAEKTDSDKSQKPDTTQTAESEAETRRASIRNKDKLEFRSPLADMGDSISGSQGYGYNQPPNKKYQQLTEENNLRRSVLSKSTTKDSSKVKQRGTSRPAPVTATQSDSPVSTFSNVGVTQDTTNTEPVQSIKDMFKSIDPTASPFC